MQELTASSQQLNDIADDLQLGISAFKLINGNLLIPQSKVVRRAPVMPVTSAAAQARRTIPQQPARQAAPAPEMRPADDARKSASASATKKTPPKK
jgi:hypothetical protein